MRNKPTILQSRIVAVSRLFQIEALDLRFSNGQERTFERLRGRIPDAVMIVPVLDRDTVLLVREYGVGVEDYFLAFPKGIVEQGETVLDAANRELMEETGYGARELRQLKSMSSSPGYSTKQMYLVMATDLYSHSLSGDEPEPIEVVPWKLSQLDKLLARADFHEARSIAAIYQVRDLLK